MLNVVAEQFKNIADDLSQAINKQDHAEALFIALRRCAVQAARLTVQLLDTDRSPKWDSLRERFDVIARPINDADAWLGWRFAIGWMVQQHPEYMPFDAGDADGIIPFGGIKKISIEQVRLWVSNSVSACRLMAHLTADVGGERGKPDAFITLDQAAAVSGVSKRTLERHIGKTIPVPDFPGGGGKASKWRWNTLREPLAKVANRPIPEIFPGNRTI